MNQESRNVLDYLLDARLSETNPHFADDYAIAAQTVKLAAAGLPHPHHAATVMILGVAPSEVWPRIVAQRKAKLGRLYGTFYFTATDLPRPDQEEDKKPPRSERISTTARKKKA